MEKPLILLTGAGGYVGKNVAPAIRNVFGLREHFRIETESNKETPGATFGDLMQHDVIHSSISGVATILHSAALNPSNGISFPEDFAVANFEMTSNLARAAIDAGVEKFIYLSSVNLYDYRNDYADESSPVGNFAKNNDYFQSKLDAENKLLELFANRMGNLIILRIGTPFGGSEPVEKLVPSMITLALNNQDLVLTSDPSTILNYVYMPDLIEAILFFLKNGHSGVFNVSSSFTLESLAKAIISKSNSSSLVSNLAATSSPPHVSFPSVSSRKLEELAQLRFMNLEDSLGDYILSMRNR